MPKKKTTKSKRPTFEESLAELETIVAKLEGGQLGLAESLEEYELGVKHLKSCYQQLSTAERRIELVSQVDASGEPQTEPFDDESSASLDEKGATRSRRRSVKRGAVKRSEVDDASSLF
ncbi:MAG: exodeoxyribonuclease VII small subunit [Planctomycetes bacterium]|nr:exodeoxyribonuclease VII small subunit [Planctomycetota bacterium]